MTAYNSSSQNESSKLTESLCRTIKNDCPTLCVENEGVIFQNGESRGSYDIYRIVYGIRGVENIGEREAPLAGQLNKLAEMKEEIYYDEPMVSRRPKSDFQPI